MTVYLDLNPEQTRRFQDGVEQKDQDKVRTSLVDAINLRMPEILTQNSHSEPAEISVEEMERLLDEMADDFERSAPADVKPLSDYALSREGLYEDHL